MQKNRVIILTGGHAATTALATIQALKKNKKLKNFDIHWIGSKTAMEGENVESIEATVFPDLGITMHAIIAGKLQRKLNKSMFSALLKVPQGFWASFRLLWKIRPSVVISFGGYVGLPVVCAAWVLRIPSILHEQTVAAGLANRLSSSFVNKIALARKESMQFFPKNKSILVGNPIMEEVIKAGVKRTKNKKPTIYITCGSRGSQIINRVVEKNLSTLLKKYTIIHQTGSLDKAYFDSLKLSLPKNFQDKYEVYATVPPLEVANMYKRADVVVARAGANTIAELAALKIPCVLIPIPWTQNNEQGKNAQMVEEMGIAIIISQYELTPKLLQDAIEDQFKNWDKIISQADLAEGTEDSKASIRLVELIQMYL